MGNSRSHSSSSKLAPKLEKDFSDILASIEEIKRILEERGRAFTRNIANLQARKRRLETMNNDNQHHHSNFLEEEEKDCSIGGTEMSKNVDVSKDRTASFCRSNFLEEEKKDYSIGKSKDRTALFSRLKKDIKKLKVEYEKESDVFGIADLKTRMNMIVNSLILQRDMSPEKYSDENLFSLYKTLYSASGRSIVLFSKFKGGRYGKRFSMILKETIDCVNKKEITLVDSESKLYSDYLLDKINTENKKLRKNYSNIQKSLDVKNNEILSIHQKYEIQICKINKSLENKINENTRLESENSNLLNQVKRLEIQIDDMKKDLKENYISKKDFEKEIEENYISKKDFEKEIKENYISKKDFEKEIKENYISKKDFEKEIKENYISKKDFEEKVKKEVEKEIEENYISKKDFEKEIKENYISKKDFEEKVKKEVEKEIKENYISKKDFEKEIKENYISKKDFEKEIKENYISKKDFEEKVKKEVEKEIKENYISKKDFEKKVKKEVEENYVSKQYFKEKIDDLSKKIELLIEKNNLLLSTNKDVNNSTVIENHSNYVMSTDLDHGSYDEYNNNNDNSNDNKKPKERGAQHIKMMKKLKEEQSVSCHAFNSSFRIKNKKQETTETIFKRI